MNTSTASHNGVLIDPAKIPATESGAFFRSLIEEVPGSVYAGLHSTRLKPWVSYLPDPRLLALMKNVGYDRAFAEITIRHTKTLPVFKMRHEHIHYKRQAALICQGDCYILAVNETTGRHTLYTHIHALDIQLVVFLEEHAIITPLELEQVPDEASIDKQPEPSSLEEVAKEAMSQLVLSGPLSHFIEAGLPDFDFTKNQLVFTDEADEHGYGYLGKWMYSSTSKQFHPLVLTVGVPKTGSGQAASENSYSEHLSSGSTGHLVA